MGPAPASLRKGDELQEFYSAYRDMHQALRARVEEDLRVLTNAVSVLEAAPDASRDRASPMQRTLEELRQLRKRKEECWRAASRARATSARAGALRGGRADEDRRYEDEARQRPMASSGASARR